MKSHQKEARTIKSNLSGPSNQPVYNDSGDFPSPAVAEKIEFVPNHSPSAARSHIKLKSEKRLIKEPEKLYGPYRYQSGDQYLG
jgi:hypothetical protein